MAGEAEVCCCLQLLAAAGEAAKLESTGIPVLSYTVPYVPGDTNASHIQDAKSMLEAVTTATKVFADACDSVTGNASIMARLKVKPCSCCNALRLDTRLPTQSEVAPCVCHMLAQQGDIAISDGAPWQVDISAEPYWLERIVRPSACRSFRRMSL